MRPIFIIFFISVTAFGQYNMTYHGELAPTLQQKYQQLGVHPHPQRQIQAQKLLDTVTINEMISKAGLTTETANWDQLDRDFLYLRTCNYNFQKLVTTYPQIPSEKLNLFFKMSRLNGCK